MYRTNGFSFPFDAFDSSEAEFYRARGDEFEQRIGGRIMGFDGKYRANPHLLCCRANDLIRYRNILDIVEDLIGPDIILFSSRFFIKDPHSTTIAGWCVESLRAGGGPTRRFSRSRPPRYR